MNQSAPSTAAEIRRALFDMHLDKASGPDGLSTLFYQKFWDIIGIDVTKAVLQVLNEGASPKAWNDTLVTLIPKIKDHMLLKDFRPISLCNVCYKKMEFEEVAIHTWAVWKEKQKYLHGDKTKPLADNVSWSYAILSVFKKARTKEKIEDASKKSNPERIWNPPRLSTLKLNVDAAVDEDRHHFSIGGALRDKQGRPLLVFGKQINQPISVVHGELLAIRESIILLHDKRLTDVQVATDSSLTVQAVTTTRDDIGYTSLCAADIRERMSESGIPELIHVRRMANNVAHSIARFAFDSLSPFVWLNGDFLSWLVKLVMDDLNQ